MAATAVGSELAIVDIVGTMTVGTVLAQARLRSERLPVAAFACDFRVCAVQRETGLLVVIEKPLLPFDRVVAQRAFFTKATFVLVVLAMAADAVFRRVAEYMRLVAVTAIGFRVFTEQREAGEIVVEEDVVLPRGFTVAVEALRAL